MLKVEKIDFTDKKNQVYTINKHQIESFPLIGGEEANRIVTQAWNQHGNTFVNAFMESYEGELLFALHTANKSEVEIEAARKAIIDVLNPLNGIIQMKVTLNSGSVFNRDITLVSAPLFPTGFENRNDIFQKVQIAYEANSPFWYEDFEIVESFINEIPNFEFPFTMSPTAKIKFGDIVPNKFAINDGQVEAPVTIQILNACVDPSILNKATGEFITFKGLTMYAQDELLIDTRFGQKKVTLNGYNVFNKLDPQSTFFNLVIGENEIEFTQNLGLPTTAKINFIYRNLYITI